MRQRFRAINIGVIYVHNLDTRQHYQFSGFYDKQGVVGIRIAFLVFTTLMIYKYWEGLGESPVRYKFHLEASLSVFVQH